MALALGKSLKWVRKLDAREYLEWMLIDQIHPIGDRRADWRAGLVADAIRGSNGAQPMGLDYYAVENKNAFGPKEATEDEVAAAFGFFFPGD